MQLRKAVLRSGYWSTPLRTNCLEIRAARVTSSTLHLACFGANILLEKAISINIGQANKWKEYTMYLMYSTISV